MVMYCPSCQSYDQVKKVTAIVAEGTWSERTYSGNPYTGWYNTTNSSQLVKNLLYDEPKKKATWGCAGCFGMFTLCSMAFLSLAGAWFGLAGTQFGTTPSGQSDIMGGLIGLAAFGSLALVFLVIQIVRGIRNNQRWSADYARWRNDFDRRYYCFRDDLVFYGNP